MALKWASSLVTAVAVAVFGTANIVTAQAGRQVPEAVNLILIAIAALAAALTAIAEFQLRLDARLSVLSDFLVNRLDEITSRLDDLETDESAGPIETYLTPRHSPTTASVVPLIARAGRGFRRGVPSTDD
jgi:hypothetical protein